MKVVHSMNKDIKIGELASLFQVSIHQIRYFEEKGVLLPKYKDINGYRMYGIREIYILSHILLLRKFNINVSDIKKHMKNSRRDDYLNFLEVSIIDIDKKIEELLTFKKFIKKIINQIHQSEKQSYRYQIIPKEARVLQCLFTMELEEALTSRQMYDNFKDFENLYEKDIIYLYDTNVITVSMETKKGKLSLPAGKYLCYEFLSSSVKDLEDQVSSFYKYIEEHNLKTSGELIIIENTFISIFHKDSLYYELQILLI